jgi:hypothetical protein
VLKVYRVVVVVYTLVIAVEDTVAEPVPTAIEILAVVEVPAAAEVLDSMELDGVKVGTQSGRVNVPLILPEPP